MTYSQNLTQEILVTPPRILRRKLDILGARRRFLGDLRLPFAPDTEYSENEELHIRMVDRPSDNVFRFYQF